MIKKLLCHILGHRLIRVNIVPHLIDLTNGCIYLGKIVCQRCDKITGYLELGDHTPKVLDDKTILTPSTQVDKNIRGKILLRYRKEGKLK